MSIEIRETKVVPDGSGAVVQVLISDNEPNPKFSVLLQARLDSPNLTPRTMLASVQLLAVQAAQKQLAEILTALRKAVEKQTAPDTSPKPH